MPLIGILAAPALAMTGGLALLCFAKVFGLSFLGEPRTTLHVTNDSPRSMLWAMGLLFFCCLWIGVAPATLVPFLQKSVEAWTGSVVANPLHALVSAGHISLVSLSLLLVVVILVVVLQRKSARQQIKKQPTWGCGYGHTIARIQYTTSSFAQTIDDFFGWVLQTDKSCEKPVGIFPVNRAFCKTHTPDVFLDHLIQPLFSKTEAFAVRIRRLVQNGIIGYYLLYSVFATCLLLMLMHF
jgi:NADH:ubiquinone oxidoreductase subunit 5 (subunit L)/multisubunit Na+/H+ antiporter MnhA subunit